MDEVVEGLRARYARLAGDPATVTGAVAKQETVQEFLVYLYEYIREDAEMVRTLDRALKARYGGE